MSNKVKISGVIITFNEAHNIERCILSLQKIVDEIVVVDSFSTDNTTEISIRLGAKVINQKFLGYIEQKNFALEQASFDYVLSLDGDEELSEELKKSILYIKNNWTSQAYSFNRFNNYCGHWMKHSGYYPDRKVRLFNRNTAKWGGSNPHDKIILPRGAKAQLLKGDLLHYPYKNIEEHIEQVKRFSGIAARAAFKKRKKANIFIHLILNPWYKFVKKFFFQLGFLDGYYGFIFCMLTSYLNFLKYLRLIELNRRKIEL